MSRSALWGWGRLVAPAVVLAVLVWRLGTGPFLDGLRSVDGPTLAAAVALIAATTVCCAWRWTIVARGLGIELSLSAAVAAYYRALFLNVTLPGGIVGDVHRGLSHGRDVSDVGRALRSVGWERFAGQVVQVLLTGVVLLALPSPVRSSMPLVVVAVVVAGFGVALIPRARPGGARSAWARVRSALASDIHDGLLARGAWRRIALASALVVAGHALTFVDRRPGGRHHCPTLPDGADSVVRDDGHGAAKHRRLGAARGCCGLGVRRGRPGCRPRRRHRCRLWHHGVCRVSAGCRHPRRVVVPAYAAYGADRTAAPRANGTCLTAPTHC